MCTALTTMIKEEHNLFVHEESKMKVIQDINAIPRKSNDHDWTDFRFTDDKEQDIQMEETDRSIKHANTTSQMFTDNDDSDSEPKYANSLLTELVNHKYICSGEEDNCKTIVPNFPKQTSKIKCVKKESTIPKSVEFVSQKSKPGKQFSHEDQTPHECEADCTETKPIARRSKLNCPPTYPKKPPRCREKLSNDKSSEMTDSKRKQPKTHTCPECGRIFKSGYHMRTHLMSHTGEKRCMCSICGKGFLQNGDLNVHFLTHTGEKPHACTECGTMFRTRGALQRHEYSHKDLQPPPKRYACPLKDLCSGEEDNCKTIVPDIPKQISKVKCGKKKSKYKKAYLNKSTIPKSVEIVSQESKPGKQFSHDDQTTHGCESNCTETKPKARHSKVNCPSTYAKKPPRCREKLSNAKSSEMTDSKRKQPKTHTCPECGRIFKSGYHMRTHLMTHTGEKRCICSICGKGFLQNGDLNVHFLTHTGEKPHACTECGTMFRTRGALQRHEYSHKDLPPPPKLFACPLCSKTFAYQDKLKQHKLVHSDIKPYTCMVCGLSMNRNGNLQKHMLIHSSNKPHKCPECGKCFKMKYDLKLHQVVHSEYRNVECTLCEKTFMRKSNLREHMLVHTKEKRHVCMQCGKRFGTSSRLKVHTLIHTNEKPHQCMYCNKRFTQRANLQHHLSTHAGKTAHNCKICHFQCTKIVHIRHHSMKETT